MIDIHSHIISGLDDGARSLEESIAIIEKLYNLGMTAIIATPHFIADSRYSSSNAEKIEKLNEIREILRQKEIPVSLCLGNEIFIDPSLFTFLQTGKITSLNGSRYLLVEFPVHQVMNDMFSILFALRSKGYVPIIAHPERYIYLQEDPKMVYKFLEMGCLFQGNFENIVAKYGKSAKKLFLLLLKNDMYHFLATDVHRADDILFSNFKKVKKKIIKMISLEKFRLFTEVNPLKVIRDEEIYVKNYIE